MKNVQIGQPTQTARFREYTWRTKSKLHSINFLSSILGTYDTDHQNLSGFLFQV